MVMAKTQIRSRIEARERAAREEDRAAERLHRALLGRHALQPGAVAAQGSRAAADDRAGALEHPAPVHQVHDEPSVGPHRARIRGRVEGVRRHAGHRRTSAPSSTAARRSCSSAATASGKTTLLKALLSDAPGLPASPGDHRRAARCAGATRCRSATSRRITPASIQKGMTAVEWLHQFDPDASRQDIHGLLGQMLFSGEEGLKPTEALSGGETARLLFCRIMLQKPNVLVLDEPTNHLDLEVDQRAQHRAAEVRGHGAAGHARPGPDRGSRHARLALRPRQRSTTSRARTRRYQASLPASTADLQLTSMRRLSSRPRSLSLSAIGCVLP